MNYLLEDIFRRADTWRGMGQHGMGPIHAGQQNRVFLHPEATAANGDAYTFSGIRTGFDALDAQLYNRGWPPGGCIEVISDQCGLDAMGVFMPMMKTLSGQGHWQVFIDPPYTPYAPLLAGEGSTSGNHAGTSQDRDEVLWSTEQALRSSTCSAVFVWLGLRTTAMRSCAKYSWQQPVTAHRLLFRSSEALEQASPASLKIHIDGYRKIKILKQRGGRQSPTISLPTDDSLLDAAAVWASLEPSETLGTSPGFRPSA